MEKLIITSLYFFLPAYIANAAPVLFKWLPYWKKPISEKHLGSHKTYRGFIVGFFAALLIITMQYFISNSSYAPTFKPYELLPYADFTTSEIFLYAFLFGIGALFGDSAKSYFKRLLKIKPGRPFIPFDQIDFILGALLFLSPVYLPDWQIILTALIVTPIIHFASNVLAYLLGIKKVWW